MAFSLTIRPQRGKIASARTVAMQDRHGQRGPASVRGEASSLPSPQDGYCQVQCSCLCARVRLSQSADHRRSSSHSLKIPAHSTPSSFPSPSSLLRNVDGPAARRARHDDRRHGHLAEYDACLLSGLDRAHALVVIYSGHWDTHIGDGLVNRSQHFTTSAGASFTVALNASYFWCVTLSLAPVASQFRTQRFLSDTNADHGRLQVSVDNATHAVLSTRDTKLTYGVYVFSGALVPPGLHSITVTNLDEGNYTTVDAIRYRRALAVPAAPSRCVLVPTSLMLLTMIAAPHCQTPRRCRSRILRLRISQRRRGFPSALTSGSRSPSSRSSSRSALSRTCCSTAAGAVSAPRAILVSVIPLSLRQLTRRRRTT